MDGPEPREQSPVTSEHPAPQPQKKWALVLDVASDCLLFILLQYMLSCVTLSFWKSSPLWVIASTIEIVLYGKFFHDMDKRLGKLWPGLVLGALCIGVVLLLVAFVGYFPVSETPVRLPWD